MSETDEQLAERYVSSFMGDGISATVYRERLVEMMCNFAAEARKPQGEPSDAQVAVRRLKAAGVGAYSILAAVTNIYDMETKP